MVVIIPKLQREDLVVECHMKGRATKRKSKFFSSMPELRTVIPPLSHRVAYFNFIYSRGGEGGSLERELLVREAYSQNQMTCIYIYI